MRKLLLSLALVGFTTGLVVAADVRGLVTGFASDKVTVKAKDGDVSFTISKDTKFSKSAGKKGADATDLSYEDAVKLLTKAAADEKKTTRVSATYEDGKPASKVQISAGFGGKKKNN